MGNFLIAVLVIVGGILASAIAKVLADDFKAWQPSIVERLLKFSVSLLSASERERYHEEWSAYIDETPGDLSKVIAATGLIWAAFRISDSKFVALSGKRLIDVIVATTSGFLLIPSLLLIAAMIKFESPGPIFFAQRRLGKNGKEFRLYKFRTMRVEGETACVTVFGGLLRRTSLDELPQLWNIIRGDMSLVGPRALRPQEICDDATARRLSVRNQMRPGLTGLAQIKDVWRHSPPVETEFDTEYVQKYSLRLDLEIILRTVKLVVYVPNR